MKLSTLQDKIIYTFYIRGLNNLTVNTTQLAYELYQKRMPKIKIQKQIRTQKCMNMVDIIDKKRNNF